MENNYSKRTFNLNNTVRNQKAYSANVSQSDDKRQIPKIERSIQFEEKESNVGSFLIRLILCITIFSGIMLMKNSTDSTVGIFYNAIEAWSVSNYTIPEEYSVEKFVSAIKSGDIVSVFSSGMLLSMQKVCDADVIVHYGDKDENGVACLGSIFCSPDKKDILCSINGTVSDISESNSFGHCITVVGEDKVALKLGFCDNLSVSVGDKISKNTVIASTSEGNDGKFYAYIEITHNGKLIDPEKCFTVKDNET